MRCSFNIFRSNEGLELYSIPAFDKAGGVTVVFTTRRGGVSSRPFNALNLGYHVGDQTESVRKNRELVCKAMGWDLTNTVAGEQVHGDRVALVTNSDKGRGAREYDSSLTGTDALITNVPGIVLSSFYADCVPLIIFDPVKKSIGLAHAGWKGTSQLIGPKTIKEMSHKFGSRPQDCLVAIGPSIGPCCYEVDSNLYKTFSEKYQWAPQVFKEIGLDKWKLNLWEANYLQMLETGIKKENVILSRICTSCNIDVFFSHRREKGLTGRMGSFISLHG